MYVTLAGIIKWKLLGLVLPQILKLLLNAFDRLHLHFKRIFHFGDNMSPPFPGTQATRDLEPFQNFQGEHIKLYSYKIINTLLSCPSGTQLTLPFSPNTYRYSATK